MTPCGLIQNLDNLSATNHIKIAATNKIRLFLQNGEDDFVMAFGHNGGRGQSLNSTCTSLHFRKHDVKKRMAEVSDVKLESRGEAYTYFA